jgi:hypothetical protein
VEEPEISDDAPYGDEIDEEQAVDKKKQVSCMARNEGGKITHKGPSPARFLAFVAAAASPVPGKCLT